jgi:RHS repeat-associated protein
MGRKSWQFASTIPAEKLSQIQNPGINTSLLVDHAYNPIHRRYEYDPAGELTRTLDKLRGEIKYEYEANGQLHSRDTGRLVDSEEFRYDAAANRLNFNTSQFDQVKDNRIKQWRDQEYTYDAWGNLIEKRSGFSKLHTFTYDCENRLVRAETIVNSQTHSVGTYRYDSLGRRVGKTSEIEGQTEHKHFLWQGLRMLREQTPWQSSLYIYEPGSYAPLARVDQNEGEAERRLYYFHTDQIGTPLEMTDVDGQIVWQATYKAWGEIETLAVNEVEQNLRFQGQYFDDETGLHYNTFRYYDPEVGRFITQDPIGLVGGNNLYQYTENPMRWVDPWGLSELLGLVTEAHGLLDPTAQKFRTTALGVSEDGKMFIASSEKKVPKIQREWAEAKGISVVNGQGHAEETIIKAGKGATSIDASRGVCLDCEQLMKEHGVKTDTHTTGKKSRKRLGGTTCNGV